MKKIKLVIFAILIVPNILFGQDSLNVIFYYKPYTDSSETNQYKTTLLEFNYDTQYHNLKFANANIEVENAIKHSDYRFIGLSGASYVYPGLDGGYNVNSDGSKVYIGLNNIYKSHFNKYGFKVIEGTSDYINPNTPPLQRVAYEFAKKYNLLLYSKFKEITNQ